MVIRIVTARMVLLLRRCGIAAAIIAWISGHEGGRDFKRVKSARSCVEAEALFVPLVLVRRLGEQSEGGASKQASKRAVGS